MIRIKAVDAQNILDLCELTANQAETATVCRFMVDDRFQHKGLEEKVLEHILRGLKIQGVKKVILMLDDANKIALKNYVFLSDFSLRDGEIEGSLSKDEQVHIKYYENSCRR